MEALTADAPKASIEADVRVVDKKDNGVKHDKKNQSAVDTGKVHQGDGNTKHKPQCNGSDDEDRRTLA